MSVLPQLLEITFRFLLLLLENPDSHHVAYALSFLSLMLLNLLPLVLMVIRVNSWTLKTTNHFDKHFWIAEKQRLYLLECCIKSAIFFDCSPQFYLHQLLRFTLASGAQ
jgi:hypothetical protein